MRTRSQIGAWTQARQQQARPQTQPQLVQTPQKKRKLVVVTAGEATVEIQTGKEEQASSSTSSVGMKSILDYISPNSKKTKLEKERKQQADRQTPVQSLPPQQNFLFKTPSKKPKLDVDTQISPVHEDEATRMHLLPEAHVPETLSGEKRSILDYISPNSKQAALDDASKHTGKTAPEVADGTQALERKRPNIRRTLTYATNEDALSDSGVENSGPTANDKLSAPSKRERKPIMDDPEYILQRISGSCAAQKQLPIVGRAAEKEAIASVLNGAGDVAEDGSRRKRSLFIVGPPGTGKSSSVKQLLGEYERRFPANAVIRMNCSTYTNPIALYSEIDAQLRIHTPWKLPYLDPYLLEEFLQEVACKQRAKCETVLVLDEVDQLLRLPSAMQKRVQEVLRFLVKWSDLPSSTLKFIGIMNGVDMHSQISEFLPQDHNVPRVLFPAYSYSDLFAILNAYLQSAVGSDSEVHHLVERRAVELIARKVASRDGDVRRAISLLQQCARFSLRRSEGCHSESEDYRKITLRDVLSCSSAMLSAGPVRDVHQLPRLPKILLFMLTSIAPSDGKPCDMGVVSQELARLRASPGFAWIPLFKRDDLQVHLASLECYALVKRPARASTKNFWKAKLTSAVTLDVVDKAIQDDPLLRMLTQRSSQ